MGEILRKCGGRLKYFFQSISTKVFVIMLILVLPFNILAIMLSRAAVDSMIEQARISVKNVMENYVTDMQNNMQAAEYLLWSMKNEESDGLTLARQEEGNDYQAARIRLYYKLMNGMRLADGTDGYFFYMKDLDDILVWDSTFAKRTAGEEFVRSEIDKGFKAGWNLNMIGERPAACLFIQIGSVIYGGWLYLDDILSQLENDIQYEKAEFTFAENPGNQRETAVSAYSKKGKFYLNACLDRQEIAGNISNVYMMMQAGAFIALFLIPVLYMMISHLLMSPLKTVNQAQKRLREGDLDYRITDKANSIEFEYSFQSFNKMADRIQTLKIENYEKELATQQMELKNLQLQIRPHFLLNTFNLIYTLVQRREEKAVQDIVLYLSEYFRYLFRSGNSLELFSKEQHLIEGYIQMASVRYPGSIDIEYVYDPEISFVRVPPLLLHNFVENIIKHVVKQGHMTHISVVGQYDEQGVTFMIMDDGPGIGEEALKELDASMRRVKSDGSHIGFSNSLRRLKYFYGEEADIVITSETGAGTCVTIRFPYNLEVQDEAFDCE
ncbi:sensor histidine kinase [Murimonas intestini]|uniref:sensor histidine kinase n=1 Tax=Murimonas intestini TaxID=1337051 RepID=UPI0016524348|nr:histidine kinase [Murimonas intestini]